MTGSTVNLLCDKKVAYPILTPEDIGALFTVDVQEAGTRHTSTQQRMACEATAAVCTCAAGADPVASQPYMFVLGPVSPSNTNRWYVIIAFPPAYCQALADCDTAAGVVVVGMYDNQGKMAFPNSDVYPDYRVTGDAALCVAMQMDIHSIDGSDQAQDDCTDCLKAKLHSARLVATRLRAETDCMMHSSIRQASAGLINTGALPSDSTTLDLSHLFAAFLAILARPSQCPLTQREFEKLYPCCC